MSARKTIAAIAALALSLPVIAASAQTASANRPVRIGLDGPNFDACGSNGRVTGLNPRGDNFLSVRGAPSTRGRQLDQLRSGHEVYVCDSTADNAWLGIVYPADGRSIGNCAVSSPVARERPYTGRCKSGWVSARFINIYAG